MGKLAEIFIDSLEHHQKMMIVQSINTFGDAAHPIALERDLKLFSPTYILNVLGRLQLDTMRRDDYSESQKQATVQVIDDIMECYDEALDEFLEFHSTPDPNEKE